MKRTNESLISLLICYHAFDCVTVLLKLIPVSILDVFDFVYLDNLNFSYMFGFCLYYFYLLVFYSRSNCDFVYLFIL
jgi:hypothetical protein